MPYFSCILVDLNIPLFCNNSHCISHGYHAASRSLLDEVRVQPHILHSYRPTCRIILTATVGKSYSDCSGTGVAEQFCSQTIGQAYSYTISSSADRRANASVGSCKKLSRSQSPVLGTSAMPTSLPLLPTNRSPDADLNLPVECSVDRTVLTFSDGGLYIGPAVNVNSASKLSSAWPVSVSSQPCTTICTVNIKFPRPFLISVLLILRSEQSLNFRRMPRL